MSDQFEFERVWESKQAMRRRLAAAPISEKLRMLDVLRERAVAIRSAKPARAAMVREENVSYPRRAPSEEEELRDGS